SFELPWLRRVISEAKSGDTIQFAPTIHSIRLNSAYGQLILDKNLTIKGTSAHPVEISGGNTERVCEVPRGVSVTLDYLNLTGGTGTDPINPHYYGKGGAVLNLGTLTINNCWLHGNTISFASHYGLDGGGGIYNVRGAQLTVNNSIVSDNAVRVSSAGVEI